MKTKIAITTVGLIITAQGFCFAPNNNLPDKLFSYEIADLTKSKWISEPIKVKKALKFESLKRLKGAK